VIKIHELQWTAGVFAAAMLSTAMFDMFYHGQPGV